MQKSASELQQILQEHFNSLACINEEEFSFKPSQLKWSKKQILGHLVDSAQNNIRRFICARYEEQPRVVYHQDQWVAINHYQDYPLEDLILLWQQLNKQLSFIFTNTSAEEAQRICISEAPHNLEWLASDYIKHLKHHLYQILEKEPFPYP